MASKSGSRKKSGRARSGDARDKGRLDAGLKERAMVREKEPRLKTGEKTSREAIDHEPMGEYQTLFKHMVDKAADMVFLLGPMGRIMYVNEAACKMLGYTREELQSMSVLDINKIHHAGNWEEHEEELKRQGSLTFENVLKTKDNRLIRVENSANYARLGDKEYNYSFIRDITGRKQMEEELRRSRDDLERRVRERTRELSESEEKYRELVESANSIIIRWDARGNLTFFNEFAEKLFGYSENEILGKNVVGTIVPSFESSGRDLTALMKDIERYPERYKLNVNENMCKNGDRVWITWTNKAICDEHGNVVEILSVGNDITEHKRAEDALNKSEEQFRVIFEQSAVGMTQVGLDGRFLRVNKKYCEITGYTKDELLGLTVSDITYPPDAQVERENIKKLLAGEISTFSSEKRYVKKDGSLTWVRLTAILVRNNGKPSYMAGVTEDITNRKRAEEALRESEERYKLVVAGARGAIWDWDVQNKHVFLSHQWKEMRGLAEDEVSDRYEEWSSRIHPEDSPRVFAALRAHFEGRTPAFAEEYRTLCKDGSWKWVSSRGMVMHDALGRVARMAGSENDITERKRAEDELKAAKLQAELYVDLMGHDINNMHQVALGYLELARDLPAGADRTAFLDKSMEVLQRSTKLIGNVRKLQKLREGVFELRDIDVCGMLAGVQSEYKGVSGKTITLITNGHDRCIAHANELLHDVFSNLVNNAVKHTGEGTDITISLDVVLDNGKRYCRVAVEDNGPGIPDNSKGRIFNRMQKGTARGMGLGLYLVRSLVDSYGGKVWAEDRVKGDYTKGARFVVMLPAVE